MFMEAAFLLREMVLGSSPDDTEMVDGHPINKKVLQELKDAYGEAEGLKVYNGLVDYPRSFTSDPRPLVAKLAAGLVADARMLRSLLRPAQAKLGDIYEECGGRRWKARTGWALPERHSPVDTWHGVETIGTRMTLLNAAGVGVGDPVILAVKLSNNKLTGNLKSVLGPLGDLQAAGGAALAELNVAGNALSGSLSSTECGASFAKLPTLVVLCCPFNDLDGPVPLNELSASCPGLAVISLSCNRLSGHISLRASSLPSLRICHLYKNQLSGPIPAEFGSCSLLEELRLWGNDLDGAIPEELGNLKRLRVLHLGSNRLTGTVPTALGDCDSLEYLYLDGNQLGGPIPTEELAGLLPELKCLTLRGNDRLAASLPAVEQALKSIGAHLVFTEKHLADE